MRGDQPSCRDRKTCQLARKVLQNETEIRGIWNAVQRCPLPISPGGISCYAGGIATSPIGRLFSFAVSPLTLVAKASYCMANERGAMRQIGCITGLDEESLQSLEEQAELVAIFALLFFAWYATLPEDEQKKKAARAPMRYLDECTSI